MTFAEAVGKRIRKLRNEAKISQEKLGRRIEMSKETVRRIEAGEGTTTATIDTILDALGKTGEELIQTRVKHGGNLSSLALTASSDA